MNTTTSRKLLWLICAVAPFSLNFNLLAKSQALGQQKTTKSKEKSPETCNELTDANSWDVGVFRPGNYCIGQNLRQSWPFIRLPHQPVPISPLIGIYTGNVTIDLKGHQLSSITPINGGIFTDFSGDENILPTIVRNGKITTSEKPAVRMVDLWNNGNMRFGHGLALAASEGDLTRYKPTVFVLENLTLKK